MSEKGGMNQDTIRKLQEIELKMLESFINVCNKLNLTYFVIGGTLLGAVRHKGFIPWDDDIDIGMPRKDYEKFIKEGQSYLDEHYFIQTFDTDSEYLMGFAKIRNSNTTFIEKSVKNRNMNHGVYIDIFPLDGVPNSKVMRKLIKIRFQLYQIKISSYFYKEGLERKNMKWRILDILSRILTFNNSLKEVQLKIDKTVKGYDFYHSSIVGNYFGIYGEKEFVPREYFGNGTLLRFEHLNVNAPEKYDLYLRKIYGDYMQLPSEENRKSHHNVEIVDLTEPYTNYKK